MITEHAITILLAVILVYYLFLHLSYLGLIFLGALGQRKYHEDIHVGEFFRIEHSPSTPPFSVIIPAYNEQNIIVDTVKSTLLLNYPAYEVIVVNDGSKDGTLQVLIEAFGLTRSTHPSVNQLPTQMIRGVYVSSLHPTLLVVDKNNGQRADAINAGANLAQYPMLCIMDADCVLEQDALLRASRPFAASPKIIAATGIVRPVNGLVVKNGVIEQFGLPNTWLGLIQAVEYIRSFQWARLGLSRLGCMLSMSGAFMVVRRPIFMDMGGCDPTTITDDIEFTIRLHRYAHEHKDSKGDKGVIAYMPDPMCYTEVPEKMRDYINQRDRWQRGTLQALLMHSKMMLNPKYGSAGLLGMPFYMVFEALSCFVEVASYVIVGFALALGYATWAQVGVFVLVAIGLGTMVSMLAVLLEERTRHRTHSVKDLSRLMLASVVDNLGFHQVHLLVRLVGSFEFLVRNKVHVDAMPRNGSYQQHDKQAIGSLG